MATRVASKKQLDEEFKEFVTRDPEAFFETMLISIRGASQVRLENKHIDFEKLVFKQWFARYEKELTTSIKNDPALFTDAYNDGLKAGKLRIIRQLLSERWNIITPRRLKSYLSAIEEDRL